MLHFLCLSSWIKPNSMHFLHIPSPQKSLSLCQVDGAFYHRSTVFDVYLWVAKVHSWRLHSSDTHLSFASKTQCISNSTKSSSNLSPYLFISIVKSNILPHCSTMMASYLSLCTYWDPLHSASFSDLFKMQNWALFILHQVLHASEDKGKTNLTRTMLSCSPCCLIWITHLTPAFHQLLGFVCVSSGVFVCLFQLWSVYLQFFLSDYKESSSFAFSYNSSFRYTQKHFWDSLCILSQVLLLSVLF